MAPPRHGTHPIHSVRSHTSVRTRPSNPSRTCTGGVSCGRGAAFTLIELLVVIAIISLLVSILLPSLQRAQELAKNLVCKTQLKNLGYAVEHYVNDYDEYLPAAYYLPPFTPWPKIMAGYYERHDAIECPSDVTPHKKYTSYGHNYYELGHGVFHKRTEVSVPSGVFLFADNANESPVTNSSPSWHPNFAIPDGFGPGTSRRHDDGPNILWIDGHVSWMTGLELNSDYSQWYPSWW